jgi:hypothetical protein
MVTDIPEGVRLLTGGPAGNLGTVPHWPAREMISPLSTKCEEWMLEILCDVLGVGLLLPVIWPARRDAARA